MTNPFTHGALRVTFFTAVVLAASVACAQPRANRPPTGVLQVATSPPSQAASQAPVALRAPAACTSRVLGGHNYFFCNVTLGLDAARDYCHAFGTELATIESRYENDAVAELVRSIGRGRHLLGHHDRVAEGSFETVTGVPMSFSAWAAGEPNNIGDEDCVELDASSVWNDIPCHSVTPNVLCEESPSCTVEFFGDHAYHVCRTAPSASPEAWCRSLGAHVAVAETPIEERFLAEYALSVGVNTCGAALAPTNGAVVCETEVPCVRRFFEGQMYLYCLRPGTTGDAARDVCRSLGGNLAVIDDVRENDFIYSNFAAFRRTHFYIDLRDDDAEGTFYSRTGPARFTAWLPNEPNNLNDEDCVELADSGWNDVPCTGDTKNAFICEMP